jgi:hypothetical protein
MMSLSEQDEWKDLMYIVSNLLGVQRVVEMTTINFIGVVSDIGPESVNEFWVVQRYYELKRKALGGNVHIKTNPQGEIELIEMTING